MDFKIKFTIQGYSQNVNIISNVSLSTVHVEFIIIFAWANGECLCLAVVNMRWLFLKQIFVDHKLQYIWRYISTITCGIISVTSE